MRRIKTLVSLQTGGKQDRTPPHHSILASERDRTGTLVKAIRVAQSEGKDWRRELQTFVTTYSTPHSVTGRIPAELLFSRQIRTNLPELSADMQPGAEPYDNAVRLADAERKEKSQQNANRSRRATESIIQQGDMVLLQQPKQKKLSTTFEPEPYTVADRKGNSVVLERNSNQSQDNGLQGIKTLTGQSLTHCLHKCLHLTRPFNYSLDPEDSVNKLCL